MHHCNVDRFYALWQDCWDYEQIPPSALTTLHYEAANPIVSGSPKLDPNRQIQLDVGIDTPIQMWWNVFKTSTGILSQDINQNKQSEWPTPRQMHFIGTTKQLGYGGMFYRYGVDSIVTLIQLISAGKNSAGICKNNTQWRLVDQPSSKKRDSSGIEDSSGIKIGFEQFIQIFINQKWLEALKQYPGVEAAFAGLLLLECKNTPPMELSESLESWMQMNGLVPEQFDRVCDNVGNRFKQRWAARAAAEAEAAAMAKNNKVFTITLSTVCGVVGLIIIVVVIVVIWRRNRNSSSEELTQPWVDLDALQLI